MSSKSWTFKYFLYFILEAWGVSRPLLLMKAVIEFVNSSLSLSLPFQPRMVRLPQHTPPSHPSLLTSFHPHFLPSFLIKMRDIFYIIIYQTIHIFPHPINDKMFSKENIFFYFACIIAFSLSSSLSSFFHFFLPSILPSFPPQ